MRCPTEKKVIKGLEQCSALGEIQFCDDNCPYHKEKLGFDCMNVLMSDALALLKAQQPRVMALEEVNALDFDYCYIEQERLPGKVYRGMLGKYIMTCETWPSITAAKISQGVDNYGKTWRCWTSRPDEKVRAETPWDEERLQ